MDLDLTGRLDGFLSILLFHFKFHIDYVENPLSLLKHID